MIMHATPQSIDIPASQLFQFSRISCHEFCGHLDKFL